MESTFPAAGPKQTAGAGSYGVSAPALAVDRAVIDYVRSHHPGSQWELLTVASDTSAPMILLGLNGGAIGGYSGTDPSVTGASLAHLISIGKARYVLLGGAYSTRGGNRATEAVGRSCVLLKPAEWHSPVHSPFGFALFDCAGREAELASS